MASSTPVIRSRPAGAATPPSLQQLLLPAVGAGLVAFAGLMTLLMYRTSPLEGIAVPVAAACGVLVARRPVVGVWLALLAVPLEILDVRFGRTTITLTEVVLLFTALVGLLHLIAGPRSRIHPVHLAFAGLLVIAVAGVLVAEEREVVLRIAGVWVAYLIVSVLVARATRQELETTLLCLVVAGGIIGLVAMLDTDAQRLQSGSDVVAGQAQTGFAQPNVLGFFLVLALAPAVVLSLRGPNWRSALSALCSVAILGGLVLPLSRGSLIAAAVALAVLLRWRRFRRVGAVMVAASLVLGLLNAPELPRDSQVQGVTARLGSIERAGEADPRAAIYEHAPRMIADHPVLGVGEGNFPLVSPSYGLRDIGGSPYDHAHHLPLTIAAEMGLLGFGAAVMFIVVIWRTSAAARRRGGAEWPVGLAVSAALAGVLVASLFDYPLRTNVIMAVVLIHVGALAGIARRSAAPATAIGAPPPGPSVAAGATA